MNQQSIRDALRVGLIYAVFGGTWILTSDWLLARFITDPEQLARLEMHKGAYFIIFTTALLFFLLRQHLARQETQVRQLQHAEALTNIQMGALEMITRGSPLPATLDHLLKGIEKQHPEMICTIQLLDTDSQTLRTGAAPSLPAQLKKATDGFAIGPLAASCGTAAYRKSPVFVADISTDPLWAPYKDLVLPLGIRACWSTPILDEQKTVVGTFAIYHRSPGLPKPEFVRVIEMVTHTAATAINKRRTEESLKENEDRFRTLFEQASDAIFVHDEKGKILSVNHAACSSLGYTQDELESMTVAQVETEFSTEKMLQDWQALKPGLMKTLRGRHRRKDGTCFPVEVSLSCCKVQGQTVMLALARNITERTEYEARLSASETSYRNFFNTVSDAIYVMEENGTFLAVNDGAVAMYGYPKEFFVGKTPEFLSAPGCNDMAATAEATRRAFSGEPQQFEWWGRRADGEIFPKEVKLKKGVYFGRDVIFATGRDITERKRMMDELRAAGERTKFYMSRMPLAFIAWDRDFRVAEWNAAAEVIFGWSTAEAIGRHAYELIVPKDIQPEIERVWQEIMQTGNMASHSINDNLNKAGQRITCEWRNTPWRDAGGKICGCLSIVSDITEKLRSEKERQQLEQQLRQSQKMEAVGQLSGGIAHDFNNILTVIQGNASLLLDRKLQLQEVPDYAEQIVRASERASGLTRQLLMFARRQQMQPTRVNLNEAIAQVTKMLQRILGEDITLHSEFAANLPLIQADIGMIEQVVLNLAVNSRDAMAEGGRLTLRTGIETLPGENPAAKDLFVRLEVMDTGMGIAPEILPRIFEPFFTTKEVGKGTGLGLATVYGIIQQHRGKIAVQSSPGQTVFSILFPAIDAVISDTEQLRKNSAMPAGNETILVVEDEAPLRFFVCDLLKRCGYTVLEAGSGPAALAIWTERRNQIDLLFTDVIMPEGMNGIDLAQRLTAEKPGLKILYTSGYTGNIEGRRNLTLIEGENYISKPFMPDVLANLIRKVLDGKSTPRQV